MPRETYFHLSIKSIPFTSQHLVFKPVRQDTNWLEEPSEQRLSIYNLNGPRLARFSCRENSATELRPLTLVEVEKTRRRSNSKKADNGGSAKTTEKTIDQKVAQAKKISMDKPFKPKSQPLEKQKGQNP